MARVGTHEVLCNYTTFLGGGVFLYLYRMLLGAFQHQDLILSLGIFFFNYIICLILHALVFYLHVCLCEVVQKP